MFKAPKAMKDSDFEYDLYELNRLYDQVQAKVFMGKWSGFLAPLLCSMDFIWSIDIRTAATNGTSIWWNPKWFLKLPPETRCTVLLHELWHVARLHFMRLGDRNATVWNYACDIRINNDLHADGHSFAGTSPWLVPNYGHMAEEDIYNDLMQKAVTVPLGGPWGVKGDADELGDMIETGEPLDEAPQVLIVDSDMLTPETQEEAIANVIKASHEARLSGHAGDIPGEIEEIVSQFLKPKVPWEQELQKFMNDLSHKKNSWKRPNRRYQHIYLPGRVDDVGALEHLAYYWDVSGSISDADEVRFNSEVKYIKDTFNPKMLTLIQFDTQITSVQDFGQNDAFEDIKIKGRGGTNLEPVRLDIIERQPTAAIIFTDLYCTPMAPLPIQIPIVWVVVNNDQTGVPYGKLIRIKT